MRHSPLRFSCLPGARI